MILARNCRFSNALIFHFARGRQISTIETVYNNQNLEPFQLIYHLLRSERSEKKNFSMASAANALGQSALYQLVAKNDRLSQAEVKDLIKKVEDTCKKYDKKGKDNGRITIDMLYEALKKKNGIECSKSDIR